VQRRRFWALELIAAALGIRLLATAFVSTSPRVSGSANLRSGVSALNAEGDGGAFFQNLLKVEQDIELSPEEYAYALEQEMEAQRKKFYIGGVVKPQNLVVPWRPVDEVQVMKDAKRQLKKNGIFDPNGEAEEVQEDSDVDIGLIGETDVRLGWQGGEPGQKVGYVVERKLATQTNFVEIATYDNMRNPQLLVKQYAGHEYNYQDSMLPPGKYTYRVLCRVRSGEITVLDQKDIVVPVPSGVDTKFAFILLGITVLATILIGVFADPEVQN